MYNGFNGSSLKTYAYFLSQYFKNIEIKSIMFVNIFWILTVFCNEEGYNCLNLKPLSWSIFIILFYAHFVNFYGFFGSQNCLKFKKVPKSYILNVSNMNGMLMGLII